MHRGLRYHRGATGEPAAGRTLDPVSGVAVSGHCTRSGVDRTWDYKFSGDDIEFIEVVLEGC